MGKQEMINNLHQSLNDVLIGIQSIRVLDEDAREAKQDAILCALAMRKDMENMGLSFTSIDERLGIDCSIGTGSYFDNYKGENHD